jgi:hypothetical protein
VDFCFFIYIADQIRTCTIYQKSLAKSTRKVKKRSVGRIKGGVMAETVIPKAPGNFFPEYYEMTLKIIRDNPDNFPKSAELKLAEISGGRRLRQAVDIEAKAPCAEGVECKDCWMETYCKHKGKPKELRLEESQTADKTAKKEAEKKKERAYGKVKGLAEDMDDIL